MSLKSILFKTHAFDKNHTVVKFVYGGFVLDSAGADLVKTITSFILVVFLLVIFLSVIWITKRS